MSDFTECVILWTNFDKNIKRVMNNNLLAEEQIISKTTMGGKRDTYKCANVPFAYCVIYRK